MVISRPRCLPGLRFDIQAQPPQDVLPRMDIAVFVGFASAGPLHIPVAVEALAQFQEIFGDDIPLAWDAERGKYLYGNLAPSVRDFFRNGGLRCWIIRIAGDASDSDDARRPEVDFFPVPGLVEVRADGRVPARLRPAFASARSPGAWFDGFQAGAALSSRPLEAKPVNRGAWTRDSAWFDVPIGSAKDLLAGDLIRFNFPTEGLTAMMFIASLTPPLLGARRDPDRSQVSAGHVNWFRAPGFADRPTAGIATIFAHDKERSGIAASVASWPGDSAGPFASPIDSAPGGAEPVALDLDLPLAEAPAAGTLLRVAFGARELWVAVERVTAGRGTGSPPRVGTEIIGEAWWRLQTTPPVPASPAFAERLTFELCVRSGSEFAARLGDLGFVQAHSRFWNALPSDADLYSAGSLSESAAQAGASAHESLWRAAATPRFPLARDPASIDRICLPLGMRALPEFFLSPQNSGRTALERNALECFSGELFLDADLVESTATTLLPQADFVSHQSTAPRRLLGIHAALGVEEATMIAVPDAVHRGWHRVTQMTAASPPAPLPIERPEWWHFKDCRPEGKIPRTREPEWGNFLPADLHLLPVPSWKLAGKPDSTGTFKLVWSFPNIADAVQFVLEEAHTPGFDDATIIYSGGEKSVTIYGRTAGDYYYRVRAVAGCDFSDWSAGVVISIDRPSGWNVNSPDIAIAESWLVVHRALIRVCAARGDLFAVLALPEHFRESDAVNYVSVLKSPGAPGLAVHHRLLPPLGGGDTNALSYGACYHPWLTEREPEGDLRILPPDGAACGILARRALSRGAWVAPANEVLAGVVALFPAIDRRSWLDLQEARVNLIRHEPAGFLALDAETLGDNEEVRLINVRRLMILLRRLVLREGAACAFEPNDDSLRRLVRQRFEGVLSQLYVRGAFAGRTANQAFEVNADGGVNTAQSIEQGRLIVEIKVAPSLPLTFLTIRLTQIGDRASVMELR